MMTSAPPHPRPSRSRYPTSWVARCQKAIPGAFPQCVCDRFSGAVVISPREGHISPYSQLLSSSPPIRGREPISREAVLPLMYRVKEDGLQS